MTELERWNSQVDAWEAKVRSLRAEFLARQDLSAAALHASCGQPSTGPMPTAVDEEAQ